MCPLHQMEICCFYNLCFKGQQENSFPKAMEDWHHTWIIFYLAYLGNHISLNLKPLIVQFVQKLLKPYDEK
jgi:hypothetical protein